MEAKAAAAAYIYLHFATNRSRRTRRWWQTRLLEKREDHGGSSLMVDLAFQHVSGHYKNFTRMSPVDFEYLLTLIGGRISKQDTHLRKSISAQDRLAVTLRFLATGDSYSLTSFNDTSFYCGP